MERPRFLGRSQILISGRLKKNGCCGTRRGRHSWRGRCRGRSKPMPAWAAWRCAQWCTLMGAPRDVGEVRRVLEEERPEALVDPIEVALADHRGGSHDERVAGAGAGADPPLGARDGAPLLGPADDVIPLVPSWRARYSQRDIVPGWPLAKCTRSTPSSRMSRWTGATKSFEIGSINAPDTNGMSRWPFEEPHHPCRVSRSRHRPQCPHAARHARVPCSGPTAGCCQRASASGAAPRTSFEAAGS